MRKEGRQMKRQAKKTRVETLQGDLEITDENGKRRLLKKGTRVRIIPGR